jgi:RNA polymerase sigma factor (sigma-70 family)
MYRVINEVRADKLVKQTVDYIYNPSFDNPAQEDDISVPMPGEDKFQDQHRGMKAPRDVPAELASLYEWPLLNKEQEQHQFRLMNFLKHKLSQLKQSVNPSAVRVGELHRIEDLQMRIAAIKERLINCNMRLVASIAKKHANQAESLFELISDGNVSLMRAVEKFDYARGNKFSTYASWAIMKNFARSIPDEKHYRERYITGHEELFEARPDVRTDEQEVIAQAEQARDRINQLLEGLDPRTRDVIRMRNGLDGSEEMTLEQIGQHFGITKERVRQINVRGMKMLREKAMAAQVDLP